MKKVTQLSAVLLLCLAGNAWGQVQYTVTDLGTLPGTQASFATGINDAGQVVGGACNLVTVTPPPPWLPYFTVQNPCAFLYSGGTMQNLSTFPGAGETAAFAINNSGAVAVGPFSGFGDQYLGGHALLYSGGTMQNLGPLLPGPGYFPNSYAQGINNSGQVVGWGNDMSGSELAFLSSGGTMQSLGTAPGWDWSAAFGINDNGQVVGWGGNTKNGGAGWHAFLYSSGTMQDLGGLAGTTTVKPRLSTIVAR